MPSGPKRKDRTDRAHRVTEVTRKLWPKVGGYGYGFVTVLEFFVTVTIWLHRKTNGNRVVAVTEMLRPRFGPGGIGYEKP